MQRQIYFRRVLYLVVTCLALLVALIGVSSFSASTVAACGCDSYWWEYHVW